MGIATRVFRLCRGTGALALGAARDEAAFWAGVAADGDLAWLRRDRPAVLVRAYLLTDLDGSGDLRDA